MSKTGLGGWITPWFPADVTPMRVGVYERKIVGWKIDGWKFLFSYWNGKNWSIGGRTPKAAMLYKNIRSQVILPWRGLTVDAR